MSRYPLLSHAHFYISVIYVRSDRGIQTASDLRGKRIGVPLPEYQQSAALWVRGFLLDDFGIPHRYPLGTGRPGAVRPKRQVPVRSPPGFALESSSGESLSALLANGEIDAVISARAPSCFGRTGAQVKRLFPDYRAVEQDVFPAHGSVSPHACHRRAPGHGAKISVARRKHLQGIRRGQAYCRCRPQGGDRPQDQASWVTAELEATQQVMGEDFWSMGAATNRPALEAMTRYSYEQGLAVRKLTIEEIFAAETLEAVHV